MAGYDDDFDIEAEIDEEVQMDIKIQRTISSKLIAATLKYFGNNKKNCEQKFAENRVFAKKLFENRELIKVAKRLSKLEPEEFALEITNHTKDFSQNESVAIDANLIEFTNQLADSIKKQKKIKTDDDEGKNVKKQKWLRFLQTMRAQEQRFKAASSLGLAVDQTNSLKNQMIKRKQEKEEAKLKEQEETEANGGQVENDEKGHKWKKGEIYQRMNVPHGLLLLANFDKSEFDNLLAFIETFGKKSLLSEKDGDEYGPRAFLNAMIDEYKDKMEKETTMYMNPLALTKNRLLRLLSNFGFVACSTAVLIHSVNSYGTILKSLKIENFDYFAYEAQRYVLSVTVGSITVKNVATNYGVIPKDMKALFRVKGEMKPEQRKVQENQDDKNKSTIEPKKNQKKQVAANIKDDEEYNDDLEKVKVHVNDLDDKITLSSINSIRGTFSYENLSDELVNTLKHKLGKEGFKGMKGNILAAAKLVNEKFDLVEDKQAKSSKKK